MRPTKRVACLLFLLLTTLPGVLRAGIDFNRDIRPILSENCVHCHGPDAAERRADLRLDTFEGATADHEGTQAVVPKTPESSGLWHRIHSTDPDELMPPANSKRVLTDEQKDLLTRWIREGAEYDQHWSFVRPKAAPDGETIDSLVAARAAKNVASLPLAPAADRRTLARRTSLDLTGLPPSREALHRFLADDKPDAYERWIDGLLASPRFGERWARPWLDLARYADSNGFQADQLRDSWAYRDWVIRALNDNMPFDQFTIEQLAGDLLHSPTLANKIATGFHRTVTCNVEAGVHVEQNRVNQVVDRVNTTATVWLGLTMECAQCHDHKYDPLSQAEYYKLFAFFNNTPVEVRNPSGKGVSYDFYGPKIDLPLDESTIEHKAALDAEHEALLAEKAELQTRPGGFDDWLATARETQPADWHPLPLIDFSTTGGEEHRILNDGSVLVTGNVPGTTVYTLDVGTPRPGLRALKVETLTHPELPGKGPGRGDAVRNNFILSEIGVEARPTDPKKKPSDIDLVHATADYAQPNWSVEKAIDGNRKTGWAIGGEFSKPHWAAFEFSAPLDGTNQTLTVTLDQNYGRGRTIGRVRLLGRTTAAVAELDDAVAKLIQLDPKKWNKKQREQVEAAHRQSHPRLQAIQKRLVKLDKDALALAPDSTLIMVEMDKPRETRVMRRGDYLDPQEKVPPGIPDVLHDWDPTDEGWPTNRLGLARWLVHPDNPLVARVTVNRYWAELFGRGIVETVEDFGTQSSPPTHPALLDHLAVQFVRSGWDVKALLKSIVLSDTYQRNAKITPEALEADPKNLWLTRGARFRLDAESIRDNALAVSGLLNTEMFGDPIMPHQPKGIWRQVGRNEPKWIDQTDANRWRRAIYIVYRRAAPYPSMVTFDAPDRAMCTVKRGRTNTPLQALTLLNDPAYVEMALALADRILTKPKDDDADHLTALFETVLARPPTERERTIANDLLAERSKTFDAKTADALIKGTRGVYEPKHENPVELAAWFHLTNALLNLDETLTRE